MDKKDLYKRIKIAGMISYIPIVLVGSIFTGYLGGSYLRYRFGMGNSVVLTGMLIGLAGAVFEVIRIIRKVLKIDSGS